MSAYRLETSQYNGAPRTNLHYVVVFFIILCHKMSRINYSFPRFLSRSPHQTDDDALFYSVCSAQRYMLCTRYTVVFLFIANEGILSRHDRHEEKKTTRSFTTVWHVNFHLVTIDLCWEIILLDVSTRLFCYSQAAAVW